MSNDLGDALNAASGSPQELGDALDAAGNRSPGGNPIVKVTWHQNRHGQFQVVYGNGHEEAQPTADGMTDRSAAERLASHLGFALTSDPIDDHLAEWS